jgi:hypothetical protein
MTRFIHESDSLENRHETSTSTTDADDPHGAQLLFWRQVLLTLRSPESMQAVLATAHARQIAIIMS